MMSKDYSTADKILKKVESNKKLTPREKILLRNFLLDNYPRFAENIRRDKNIGLVS